MWCFQAVYKGIIIVYHFSLLLCFLFVHSTVYAACPAPVGTVYTCVDSSSSEVQSCVDAAEAASGGTVIIPDGNSTYSSGVTKTVTHDLIIQGSGIASTVLTSSSTTSPILTIVANGITKITISNIKFVLNTGDNTNGVVNIRGTSPNRLIKNNYFDMTPMSGSSGRALLFGSPNDATQGGGVIFKNTFYNNGTNGQGISIHGNAEGATYYWTGGTTWGTGNANYTHIEGNTFIFLNGVGDGAFDAYSGSHVIFRHNTVNGTNVGWHGNDSSSSIHSAEVYCNSFASAPSSINIISNMRGGTALIWGNRADSTYAIGLTLALYRSCEATGRDGKLCDGNGTYDSNSDASGYVCFQQPGTTGTNGVTSAPILAWDNKQNTVNDISFSLNSNYIGALCVAKGGGDYDMADHVAENRDYCQHSTTMPSACNGVTTVYTPYTCPHPLTGLTGSCNSAVAGTAGYNVALSSTSTFGSFTGSMR